MAELTVIIPFCNEGEEVGLTIKSCKEFAKGEVDFLLIDDYSSDNYDYMSVVKEHNCQFIRHNKQLGVSPSRDDGVNLCKSPYFVLLDGHMAMLQQGWDECVLSYVKTDPRAIWCGQTQCLQANREVMPPTASFGAKITPAFNAEWVYKEENIGHKYMEIECVLGAAYVSSVAWWKHIHGLRGISGFGSDEAFMSLKTRLAGGKCYLIKDWLAGHIYADKRPHPYNSTIVYDWQNRIVMIQLTQPKEKWEECFQAIRDDIIADKEKKGEDPTKLVSMWDSVKKEYVEGEAHIRWITQEREYLDKIYIK